MSLPRNIRLTSSGKYEISKYKDGKSYSFGSYDTLAQAEYFKEYFKSHDWPLSERFIHSTPKFIQKVGDKFKVEKSFGNKRKGDRKRYSYGTFDSLEEAVNYRDKCIRENWDESLRPVNPRKYIQKKKGRYWIIKDNVSYGIFDNLEDALYERDLLIKCDWSYDALESIDETRGNGIAWLTNVKLKQTFQKQKKRNDIGWFNNVMGDYKYG